MEYELFEIENNLLKKLNLKGWNELKNLSLKNYNENDFTNNELNALKAKIDADNNIEKRKKQKLIKNIDSFIKSKLNKLRGKGSSPLLQRTKALFRIGETAQKHIGEVKPVEIEKVSDMPITEKDLQPQQVNVTAKPLEEIKPSEKSEEIKQPQKSEELSDELEELNIEELKKSDKDEEKIEKEELKKSNKDEEKIETEHIIDTFGPELKKVPKSERPIIIDFLNVFLDENLVLWRNYKQTLNISKEESYEIIKNNKIGRMLLILGRAGEKILKDLKQGGDEKLDPEEIRKILKDYGLGNKLSAAIVSVIIGGIIAGTTYSELHKNDEKEKIKKIKKLRKKYNL